jgi:hypothetical protein
MIEEMIEEYSNKINRLEKEIAMYDKIIDGLRQRDKKVIINERQKIFNTFYYHYPNTTGYDKEKRKRTYTKFCNECNIKLINYDFVFGIEEQDLINEDNQQYRFSIS